MPAEGGEGTHLVELRHLNPANTEIRLKFGVDEKLQVRYKTTQVIHENDF